MEKLGEKAEEEPFYCFFRLQNGFEIEKEKQSACKI